SDEAADLRSKLNNLQSRLMNSQHELDLEKGDSMVYLYKKYAVMYPNDSLSVEYLFRAAEIQMGMNKNKESLKSLSFIQEKYPESNVMPMLLQFKAFIYDDKFNDYDNARACMDELIKNYPESELIPNAKAYRNMIGKDPSEMFQKADSVEVIN
ncbi:MAG: tetratricopeptide repeat protein, partial [Bacteroidales bacterium]|nr:tetratricopeptide repeat protein [Bacteroidales bacterium]